MKRFTSQAGGFGNAMASFGSDSAKKANNLTGGMFGKQPTSEAAPTPPQPERLHQRDTNRPARILSLDGGGVRGYSTLIILKRFMLRLGEKDPSKGKILPADYFDLIIGTSTGGIIALMLGRLRMSVDDAITAYQELSKKIFSGGIASALLGGNILSSENPGLGLGLGIVKGRELDQYLNMAKTSAFASDTAMYDAVKLEANLKGTIGARDYTAHNQEALLGEADPNNCYTAIVTARQNNATAPYIMRSYQRAGQPTDDKVKIWEAARATSAAPAFFAPITVGQLKVKYIDGAVTGHCNPSELAREEVDAVWPGRKISLLLSLGTGAPTEVSLAGSNSSKLVAFIALSANTVQVHERVMRYFNQVCGEQHSPYVRLSVEHTIDSVRLDEYEKLDAIAAASESYLDTEVRRNHLDRALGLGDRKDNDMPQTSYSSNTNSRSNSLQTTADLTETGA